MEQSILDLKFKSEDLGKTVTIREFFFQLLKTLWIEKEEFSGSNPFGNSGWDGDLIKCLIKNKLIKGTLDDGFLDEYDEKEVDKFVLDNIIKPIFNK